MATQLPNGLARIERDGHRADVLLSRPEKRNAMNRPLIADLTAAFERVGELEAVRAVTLLGEGPVFSAGMDLEMMHESDRATMEAITQELRTLFDRIENCSRPVVAGIKRAAVGGAFELTLPADFRVLGAEAAYGVVEVKLGVFPHGGATQRLPRLVGLAKAKELVLTGEYVAPAAAERIGLVTEVCADDAVDERARALADDLAKNAPLGMERAKTALNGALELPLEEGLDMEADLAMPLYETADRKEGFGARLEGREPSFEGE
ncbi:enoyl-CoA hydratase/isomerase family protein [Natronomonas sp. EA1]|uniref:enoyl-CoA hydratase/isomerase family protein n=1 Tax=Natronomonas sp. EA1 TaxID=3421655 RepID=UPI003EBC004A